MAREPGVFVRPVIPEKGRKVVAAHPDRQAAGGCASRDRGAGIGAGQPVLLIRRLHQRETRRVLVAIAA